MLLLHPCGALLMCSSYGWDAGIRALITLLLESGKDRTCALGLGLDYVSIGDTDTRLGKISYLKRVLRIIP